MEEVRIQGLMIGIELSLEGSQVVKDCLERRLLVNCTQGNVIRLLPAMNMSIEEAEEGCTILIEAIKSLA